jgi:hypothetical protein
MRAVAFAILAIVLGVVVGVTFQNPVPGIAFGLGLLLGFAGSVLVIPALRAAPAGLKGAATDDAESGWAEFHRELARARRFDRPFATIRVPLDEPIDDGRLVAVRNELAANARRIDRIWIDDSDLLVLLPETSRDAAVAVMDRITALLPAMETRPTLAIFPDQGITSGVLIGAIYAQQRLDVPTTIGTVRPELTLDVTDAMDELAAQSG